MGTRGYLIFKYKRVYYVIYNHWDSYPSGMGVATVKVLINLCKQFKGNVTLARLYLRDLLEPLVERSNKWCKGNRESCATTPVIEDDHGEIDESKLKTMNESSNQHYIIWKHLSLGFQIDQMKLRKAVIEYEVEPSSTPPMSDGTWIQYMWEVDLDEGRFGMGTCHSGDVFVYWPWKALYLMPADQWEEDAKLHIQSYIRLRVGYFIFSTPTPFERKYKVILIQAYVRRFLAKARAMKPPNGLFYFKAKRKFEELQNSYLV